MEVGFWGSNRFRERAHVGQLIDVGRNDDDIDICRGKRNAPSIEDQVKWSGNGCWNEA